MRTWLWEARGGVRAAHTIYMERAWGRISILFSLGTFVEMIGGMGPAVVRLERSTIRDGFARCFRFA